jgi:hypothetical protein
MTQQHDYIESSIWYTQEITDPYQVIAEFFFAGNVGSFRKGIKKAVLAAFSDKTYSRKNPGTLLWEFERIESVINAAYLINQENKKSPIIVDNHNLLNKNLYFGWEVDLTEWDFLPRVLSLKEYKDPYLAFKRFFKFKELADWKSDLHDIVDYALIRDSLISSDVDGFSIYFYLVKLVEAAHLIDVREINHIGGIIKNRNKAGS